MRARHWDIFRELEYVVDFDGFVETCLDLRDNMLFYDRGLILAGYASTVELLITLAYMWASLASEEEAEAIFDLVESLIHQSEGRLTAPDMPIDVRMMVDGYLDTGGWIIKERLPLYRRMFAAYMNNDYNPNKNINELLYKAQKEIDGSYEKALYLVSQVGAMALRGRRIRPSWLYVLKGQLQIWVRGILSLVGNFAAAPHFSFPFDEISREREKWSSQQSAAVIDLKAFRNRRYPFSSLDYTNGEVLENDELDHLLTLIFSGTPDLDIERRVRPSDFRPVRPLLQAVIETPGMLRPEAPGDGWAALYCLRILRHIPTNAVIDSMVDAILWGGLQGPLLEEAIGALRFIGQKAVNRIVKRIETLDSDEAKVILARVLSGVSPSEEVLNTLVALFQTLRPASQRISILQALVEYGDPQVLPVLQSALMEEGELGPGECLTQDEDRNKSLTKGPWGEAAPNPIPTGELLPEEKTFGDVGPDSEGELPRKLQWAIRQLQESAKASRHSN